MRQQTLKHAKPTKDETQKINLKYVMTVYFISLGFNKPKYQWLFCDNLLPKVFYNVSTS